MTWPESMDAKGHVVVNENGGFFPGLCHCRIGRSHGPEDTAPLPARPPAHMEIRNPYTAGADGSCSSMVIEVPERPPGLDPRMPAPGTTMALLNATNAAARVVGRSVDHADWTVTASAEEADRLIRAVAEDELPAAAVAASDQLRAWLAAHPGREVAVGIFWWAWED